MLYTENPAITASLSAAPSRSAAVTAGLGLLLMFIAAMFANFVVIEGMVVPDDAAATLANLQANEQLFRLGLASFLLVVLLDVLVAWSLYIFLKPADARLSLLAAWLRLAYSAMYAAAMFGLALALRLLSNADFAAIFPAEQLPSQVMLALAFFQEGWMVGLLFFGVSLLVLGVLVFRSGYAPKILGVLLFGAGVSYLVDSGVQLLLPNYADFAGLLLFVLLLPMIVGEMAFCFWLLLHGGKTEQSVTLRDTTYAVQER